MATRVYQVAKELGISNNEMLSRLAERGIDVKNHFSSLTAEQEQLALSLFSAPKPAARESKRTTASKGARRRAHGAGATAVQTLERGHDRVGAIESRVGDLETLTGELRKVLARRREHLNRLRAARAGEAQVAAPPGLEVAPVEVAPAPEIVPLEVHEVVVGEEAAPAAVAEALAPAAAAPASDVEVSAEPEDVVAPAPIASDEEAAPAALPEEIAAEAEEVAEAEQAQQPAPPAAKPARPKGPPRRVVTMSDRLGGPKPVITKPATPLTRAPVSRSPDGRRRPVGAAGTRERPGEQPGRGGEEAAAAAARAGGGRARPARGKARFFPKHGGEEETWTEGPSAHHRAYRAKPIEQRAPEARRPEKLEVTLPITVKEFSLASGLRQAEIIKFFLMRKTVMNANSHLDQDSLETLGIGFNIEVIVRKETDLEAPLRAIEERVDPDEMVATRCPIVALLGHVDHGKTSILDRIRGANVHEREFGGITQHISAFRVELPTFTMTFVDTPGHAAFTQIRARGARVTDIAILVVAADDGPMPQTEEAISHIRAADVPIVVAINKIDLPSANVLRTKQRLAELGLIPPEWGGNVEMVEVSALKGEGIDDLLETIHLMGQVMGLKANPNREGLGVVLDATSSGGRGILVTSLIQNGTLRTGDYALCGCGHGRIRGLWSTSTGEALTEAGPSTPVEIMGLSEVPEAGDRLYVLRDEQLAVSIADKRLSLFRESERAQHEEKVTLENLFDRMKSSDDKEVRLVLKADVTGSVEALETQALGLSTEEVKVKVLHAGVGMVTENDVVLADASKGIVVAFNVSTAERARAVAEERGIQIRTYNVIYELLDDVKAALEDRLAPVYEEVIRGHAEIRQIFKASRIGTIAGCMVTDGTIARSDQVRLMREGQVVFTGAIASLKREKDDTKEVREGFECGIKLADCDAIQQGDTVEAFRMVSKRRTL